MSNNLSNDKKAVAVSMLCEGNSIRAIERMTGVHRDTIMRLGVRMSERILYLGDAVQTMHRCKAVHESSHPLREVFQGQTVWEGVVESFALTDHPKAKRCYAWATPSGDVSTVLEIPPVTSPQTAVKAYVASLGRK